MKIIDRYRKTSMSEDDGEKSVVKRIHDHLARNNEHRITNSVEAFYLATFAFDDRGGKGFK
jgi:hypothetical protein